LVYISFHLSTKKTNVCPQSNRLCGQTLINDPVGNRVVKTETIPDIFEDAERYGGYYKSCRYVGRFISRDGKKYAVAGYVKDDESGWDK
jgi:hypothetical protein